MAFVSIGGGHKLEAVTARQFMLMNYAFFLRFGVDIRVTWSTRDSAEQIRLLNKYYRRTTRKTGKWWDGSWWEKRPGKTTTVATPGTSRHERGFALDIRSFEWSYNREMAQWARTNAGLYGFKFNVAGEDWHIDRVLAMRITSGRQRAIGTAGSTSPKPSSGSGTSTPEPENPLVYDGESNMIVAKRAGKDVFVLGPQYIRHIGDEDHVRWLSRQLNKDGVVIEWNSEQFTTCLNAFKIPLDKAVANVKWSIMDDILAEIKKK